MTVLSPVERGVLFTLMAEGRPLRESADLKARFKIGMTANHRKNLNTLGLISSSQKPLTHHLTTSGWRWVYDEVKSVPGPGLMGLGPLYATLNGIDRALSVRNIGLQEFFSQHEAAPPGDESKKPNSAIADAAWSDSEQVLAFALQDIASFQRVLERFDASTPDKHKLSLRQINLAAEAVFQNLRLVARHRGLQLSYSIGDEATFDPVTFDCPEDLSTGATVSVKKSPVVKLAAGGNIIVAKGQANPV
jgi:hypothetical protein